MVVSNPSHDQSVTALVELDNFKGGYLIASPEVPETEESNGKCDIKALSAVVFMEK